MGCKLCQDKLSGMTLSCSKGSICKHCVKNINDSTNQPITSFDSILWCLAETYFRKGKGEDTSFEKVWNKNDNLKLVKFEDLWKDSPVNKK